MILKLIRFKPCKNTNFLKQVYAFAFLLTKIIFYKSI